MKHVLLGTFFVLVATTARCQLISDSVQIDGHYRTFHFLKPAGPQAALCFALHGSGGNGRGVRNGAQKLEAMALQENILLVYPDGYQRFWNECRRTAQSAANLENINEEAFFQAMITYFEQKYQTDPRRVVAIGTSGGGHMAYKLALTLPEKFRAITALIASLPDTSNLDCAEKRVPLPVLIVNGTADGTNPYEGGEVRTGSISLGLVRSTESTFRYWSELAGYRGKPKKQLLPDTDPTDGKTIEKYTFRKRGKPEVTLLKVIGGEHNYPGDIDVYLEAWAFFKRQF
ncbi:PHB depolymerase family esterase [Rhabdobacter roseus]|uniref:Polyhydroxybutyrate depolymerase n=1 Tax=Rhabdobacter roseus TaxID=1655419 RepID=A0A840TPN4_9BACT|nr:prolyl oligopeptidase family serine peptidase [Rhabdobacter roseus]MBB5285741.1 polyhydroxybutyrate depolymerase [Rhabdobacter roseus]